MSIRGGCLCGGVQYEIVGKLHDAGNCHCSMCRRIHGSAFGAYARVEPGDFRWLSGEDLISAYESSPGNFRCFCGQCGCPLGARADDGTLSWVTLGTIAGDPGIRPGAHIFVGSKAPWYEISDALPQFEKWPPGFGPESF